MNCERMETRLIAYLDGKANDADRREVESHLAACAACRTRASDFRALSGLLDGMPALEPTPSFDARLRQRIAAEPAPGWFAWLRPLPRFAMAVAMLLAMAAWIGSGPATLPGADQRMALRGTDEDFKMINNLQVLEDYDTLANFEALSELPQTPQVNP